MLERAQPMEQVNLDGGRFVREAKVSLRPAALFSVTCWGFVCERFRQLLSSDSPTDLLSRLLFFDEFFVF